MQKPAVLLSLALFLSACSLLDEGSEQPNNPDTNNAPTVQLTASPQSGPAPLTVNLNATATDPEGDTLSYSWSLQGLGSAATAKTVLNEAGIYPITVTVSDGTNETQASTTLTVTGEGPVDPEPPTDPEPAEPQITIKASPGGPAPWAVRYDYSATGYPKGSSVSLTCGIDGEAFGNSNIVRTDIDMDTTACLHLANTDTVTVTVLASSDPASEVLDVKTIKANIQSLGNVPFAGTWRFTLGDKEPVTFSITEYLEGIGGKDATGSFDIGYQSEDDAGYMTLNMADFYYGSTVEKVEVEPLEDGTQRFVPSDNWEGEPFVLEKID